MKLWCIYGGNPVPTIQWRRKGRGLPHDRISYENFGKTLVINKVDFDDEGEYICEASNRVGLEKHHSVDLKVHAAPYFTKEPSNQIAAEGEVAVIECEASGYPTPSIQWTHNGKSIRESPLNARRSVGKNLIIIRNLTIEDTGNYGCNATTEDSYVYKDVFVNVAELPPEIVKPPQSKTRVVVGSEAILTCGAVGAPRPTVEWYHGEEKVLGARFSISADGSLLNNKVLFTDEGQYWCQAINKYSLSYLYYLISPASFRHFRLLSCKCVEHDCVPLTFL